MLIAKAEDAIMSEVDDVMSFLKNPLAKMTPAMRKSSLKIRFQRALSKLTSNLDLSAL